MPQTPPLQPFSSSIFTDDVQMGRCLDPNFDPTKSLIDSTAIWVHLLQLPIGFYGRNILECVGKRIGPLLKAYDCTSFNLRGRYARICVQIELEVTIKTSVTIEIHRQSLIYEGEIILYKYCGVLGHTSLNCNLKSAPFPGPRDPPLPETSNTWDNCGKLSMTASGKYPKTLHLFSSSGIDSGGVYLGHPIPVRPSWEKEI
ncbi:hypothetical protein BC332_13462 [Capsicum chinense]|nr:hypothetical protein BC332_13462 [Capsicum chinense]